MTTMCVVAWTPADGLCGAWVGDSAIFVLAVQVGEEESFAWSSDPHGGWSGNTVNSTLGWHTELREHEVGWFADSQIDDTMRTAAETGVLIVAATDGLYEPFVTPYGRQEPAAQLGEALTTSDRASADIAAQKLMGDAARKGTQRQRRRRHRPIWSPIGCPHRIEIDRGPNSRCGEEA